MRKLLLIAVCLAVPSAIAEKAPIDLSPAQIRISWADEGGGGIADGVHKYDNLAPGSGTLVAAGTEIGDDLQLAGPFSHTWTHAHYVYNTGGPRMPHTDVVKFYQGDSQSGFFSTIAAFNVPIPFNSAGSFLVDLYFPAVHAPGSNHIWMGVRAGANKNFPLGGMPAIGFSNPDKFYTGFPPNIHGLPGQIANLRFAVGVPEPSTIGAFAFGGLLVLRRRR